jgi:hypothetical protein
VGDDLPPTHEWRDESAANDQPACYRIVATGRGFTSTSPVQCTTPKADPHPPHGVVMGRARAGQAAGTAAVADKVPPTLTLLLDAEDNPFSLEHPPFDGAFLFPEAVQSSVREMMISNRADFAGAEWEPYATSKRWTLDVRPDNTATVFVLFKDGAGNVSDVAIAVFDVDPALSSDLRLFLPTVSQ